MWGSELLGNKLGPDLLRKWRSGGKKPAGKLVGTRAPEQMEIGQQGLLTKVLWDKVPLATGNLETRPDGNNIIGIRSP